MRNLKTFAIFALLFIANSMSAQSTFNRWPALKDFHEVMSETFHPAEEGNYFPIKNRSEELITKGTLLLTTDIPAEFRTNTILSSAERIQLQSKALNRLVLTRATNAELLKSITELHDTFHEIVGLCSEQKK